MKHEHTPGQWKTDGQHVFEATRPDNQIATLNNYPLSGTRKGNAQLIASAPELLAALEQCEIAMMRARIESGKVDDLNGDRRTSGGRKLFPCNQSVVKATDDTLTAIRELIAKAKGGE